MTGRSAVDRRESPLLVFDLTDGRGILLRVFGNG